MVGRGVVWVLGLALGVSFVACGGRSTELEGEGGEAGEVSSGGSKATGGRSAAGRGPVGGVGASPDGGTSGGVAVGGASGSVAVGGDGGTGVPSGGTSGTSGMCRQGGSQGGWTGDDACPIPWWGTSLDGAKGLLECPEPYDPSLLAYGQTNLPPCFEVTGPVAEGRSSEGGLSCCYHLDERPCCDSTYQQDFCIEIPYFGDGTGSASIPTVSVDDPATACGRSSGSPIELSHAEAAERMIGVWLTCGGDPEFTFRDGIIFRGDGTFHVLDLDDDLRLSESEGCLDGGLWGFYGGTGQVDLFVEDFTRIVFPTFTSGPEERLMLDSVVFVRANWPIGG